MATTIGTTPGGQNFSVEAGTANQASRRPSLSFPTPFRIGNAIPFPEPRNYTTEWQQYHQRSYPASLYYSPHWPSLQGPQYSPGQIDRAKESSRIPKQKTNGRRLQVRRRASNFGKPLPAAAGPASPIVRPFLRPISRRQQPAEWRSDYKPPHRTRELSCRLRKCIHNAISM